MSYREYNSPYAELHACQNSSEKNCTLLLSHNIIIRVSEVRQKISIIEWNEIKINTWNLTKNDEFYLNFCLKFCRLTRIMISRNLNYSNVSISTRVWIYFVCWFWIYRYMFSIKFSLFLVACFFWLHYLHASKPRNAFQCQFHVITM